MIRLVTRREVEMNAVQPYTAVEDAGSFPRGGTEEQIWRFLLRYAVRAPSGDRKSVV